MGLFNFLTKEKREFSAINSNQDDLTKILEGSTETPTITREMAMQIPSLKAGVGFIAVVNINFDFLPPLPLFNKL